MAGGSFMLIPTLPQYAQGQLGAPESQLGYIMGFFTLAALMVRPVSGILLDTIGRKIVYFAGLWMFLSVMPLYYLSYTMTILLGIRLLHGFGWGVLTTGGSTIVSDIVPPARRGEGIGYFGMSFTLGMALGPTAGLWLIKLTNFQTLFAVEIVVMSLSILLSWMVQYPVIEKVGRTAKGIQWSDIVEPRCLSIASIGLFSSMIYGGILTFISLFAQERGLEQAGNWFFIAYASGLTIVRPIAGKWLDRYGPHSLLGCAFALLTIGVWWLALTTTGTTFLVASFITGAGMGAILPTVITMTVSIVVPQRRGAANSTFFSGVDIGIGLGAILLSYVVSITSLQTMYLVCGGLVIIPTLIFFGYAYRDYTQKKAEIDAMFEN
jgi:MFS family permease